MITAPRPASDRRRRGLLGHLRRIRRDVLSALPAHLFDAKMAEFRSPFLRSYLINDPVVLDEVLCRRPGDFPKSPRIARGLSALLGGSVFVTDGEDWERARRILDPAFAEMSRRALPDMNAAAVALRDRLGEGSVEIEAEASRFAADVIFRLLFGVAIDDARAARSFEAFRAYQRAQPAISAASLLSGLPALRGRRHARRLRGLIRDMVSERRRAIAVGERAPERILADRLLSAVDAVTGRPFSPREVEDQIAILFLAGHETSAAALSWALWLLASCPDAQDRVAAESAELPLEPRFPDIAGLRYTRDVMRETLRLFPPVPMSVREARCAERLRDRDVPAGSQIVVSPWHLHRQPARWRDPDGFDPERWCNPEEKRARSESYIPFSKGPRVCPGAGLAMTETAIALARILAEWRVSPTDRTPVPVAHMTLRARDGIWLSLERRRGV